MVLGSGRRLFTTNFGVSRCLPAAIYLGKSKLERKLLAQGYFYEKGNKS